MKLASRFESIQREIVENPEAGESEKQELLELRKKAEHIENQEFAQFFRKEFEKAKEDVKENSRGPLCSCDRVTCDVKNGNIPQSIRNAMKFKDYRHVDYSSVREEMESSLLEWDHGEPVFREIIEKWDSRKAEIEQEAMDLQIRIQAMGESDE